MNDDYDNACDDKAILAEVGQDTAEPCGRHAMLLRAAYDLLTRSARSPYVLDSEGVPVHYDGADCDGCCLRAEIADELGLDDGTDPIPLDECEEG